MKTPLFIKIILNVVFYIVYVLVISLLFGLALWALLNFFDKPLIEDWTIISYVLQAFVAIIVLFVTILYRKYFYIKIESENKEIKQKEEKIEEKEWEDELEISIGKNK